MRNNMVLDSGYAVDEQCWVAFAGRVIRAAAEEEYKIKEEIGKIQDKEEDCLYKIKGLLSGNLFPSVFEILLNDEMTVTETNRKLMSLQIQSPGDSRALEYVRKYKNFQLQVGKLRKKLKGFEKFFGGMFYDEISMGINKETVREGVGENLKRQTLWRDIYFRNGHYEVSVSRNQKKHLKKLGYETEKSFEHFEDAVKYRDRLDFLYEEIKEEKYGK